MQDGQKVSIRKMFIRSHILHKIFTVSQFFYFCNLKYFFNILTLDPYSTVGTPGMQYGQKVSIGKMFSMSHILHKIFTIPKKFTFVIKNIFPKF